MEGILKLSWINIKSGLIYGLLAALLAVALYAVKIGDVFALNWQDLVNAGVFGFLAVLISLLKNLLTNAAGKFAGVVEVIPNKID